MDPSVQHGEQGIMFTTLKVSDSSSTSHCWDMIEKEQKEHVHEGSGKESKRQYFWDGWRGENRVLGRLCGGEKGGIRLGGEEKTKKQN